MALKIIYKCFYLWNCGNMWNCLCISVSILLSYRKYKCTYIYKYRTTLLWKWGFYPIKYFEMFLTCRVVFSLISCNNTQVIAKIFNWCKCNKVGEAVFHGILIKVVCFIRVKQIVHLGGSIRVFPWQLPSSYVQPDF